MNFVGFRCAACGEAVRSCFAASGANAVPSACLILLLGSVVSLFVPSPLSAHPVPRDQYDRKIKVKLVPAENDTVQVLVEYRLEIEENTAVTGFLKNFSDQIDVGAAVDKRDAFYKGFTRCFAPLIAGNVTVRVDDKSIPLQVARHGHQLKDEMGQPLGHLRCDFAFVGTFTATPGQTHQVQIQEDNYIDKTGLIDLSVVADSALPVQDVQQASEQLKQKTLMDLEPGEEPQLRQASARFTLPKTSAPFATKPVESVTEEKEKPLATSAHKHEEETKLLDLFFDSSYSVPILLVLALFFGAAHALTPGHGKTLVAAYLVGENGTMLHALVLGLVTTLTHTGAVILIAIALGFVPTESIAFALQGVQLLFGLLIVGIGAWLLLCRLSGRADHVHIGGGHHHHHHEHDHHHHDHAHADHSHDEHGHVIPHAGKKPPVGLWRLIVLGMQGGIVPCWDAVIMLCAAIAANLLWLALPLLLAFSVGLAGVLVAVGMGVVYSKRFAESRWGDSRLVRALPILSACIVIALGLWLCYEGVHGQETHLPRGQVNASR